MKPALACLVLLAVASAIRAQPTDPGWFDLPVPGGERTLATMRLMVAERGAALSLAARLPTGDDARPGTEHAADAFATSSSPSLGASEDDEPYPMPTPLSADLWREVLELRADEDLFARLLADRAATLVAAGFASTDASIRQWAARDRGFVRRIYREAPGAFAVVARSLRIDNGRVVVPGGEGADRIWDALAGESPAKPAEFITALVRKDGGRLAWYFDTIATLDASQLHAAWPARAERERLANARVLYEGFRRVEIRWRVEEQPFRRAAADPWAILNFTDHRDGALTGPPWQWFWQALFSERDLDVAAAAALNRSQAAPITLTWLTRALADQPLRDRREKFELFRLAQRVFPDVSPTAATDLATALSGYRRYKALLLAIERMQIATPATWAALVNAARALDRGQGERIDALASFQGAFAIVSRMWHVGTIDTATAERLLLSLADALSGDRRVPRAVARWMKEALTPALQPRTVLDALAGPVPENPVAIEWEGLEYRLDFAAAERARLDRIRALTNVPSLDDALASGDSSAIATALKSLSYAIALGDPDGAVTLGPDIASRHDFGVGAVNHVEEGTAWAMPIEMQIEGKPWHVRGSLIGLDLGLARLSMRHLSGDQMPNAPTLTMNDYATLTQTAVSMRPLEFADADRDEIVAALARGRQRVADAGTDLARLAALASEADLSPALRESLPWLVAREPETVRELFSLRDLLWLGKPSLSSERLDRWGMLGRAYDGRLSRLMPRARAWEDFAGRADTGVMATQVPDFTLRLAEETARLGLPAALVPAMLAYAIQDYWYGVRARFADDWLAMSRHAAALQPERAEDYVAALAGSGLLRLREVRH